MAAALVATLKEAPVLSSLVFTEVGDVVDTPRTALLVTQLLCFYTVCATASSFVMWTEGFPLAISPGRWILFSPPLPSRSCVAEARARGYVFLQVLHNYPAIAVR